MSTLMHLKVYDIHRKGEGSIVGPRYINDTKRTQITESTRALTGLERLN